MTEEVNTQCYKPHSQTSNTKVLVPETKGTSQLMFVHDQIASFEFSNQSETIR